MCTSIIKCVLSFVNSLFMMIAVVLIAAGVILAFVPSTVMEPAYKAAKASAGNMYSLPDNAKDIKDIPFIYQIGVALFAFGIFLLVVSLLGWCGTCCTSCCRCLLIAFAAIIVVLMIAEIIVGTLFYVTDSPLHKSLRSDLKNKIRNDYNFQGNDSFSMSINLINKYFECCGIDNADDFLPRNPFPKSCDKANYYTGCYTKLTDLISDNIVWAGLALAGLLLIQLVEVVFAIIVYHSDSKVSPF